MTWEYENHRQNAQIIDALKRICDVLNSIEETLEKHIKKEEELKRHNEIKFQQIIEVIASNKGK